MMGVIRKGNDRANDTVSLGGKVRRKGMRVEGRRRKTQAYNIQAKQALVIGKSQPPCFLDPS
jgi:hypothetical protein